MKRMTPGPVAKYISLIILAVVFAVMLLPTLDARTQDCKRSQDCALDAFSSGKIRSLPEVLVVARERVQGEVVKIELEQDDGIWVYEVKIVTPSGKRREVKINAQTLAVIKVD